jgi:hypothetical protein
MQSPQNGFGEPERREPIRLGRGILGDALIVVGFVARLIRLKLRLRIFGLEGGRVVRLRVIRFGRLVLRRLGLREI